MTDYDSTLVLFSHSNKLECSIFDGALIVCVRVRACVRVRESGVYASAQLALKSAFFLDMHTRPCIPCIPCMHTHTHKRSKVPAVQTHVLHFLFEKIFEQHIIYIMIIKRLIAPL